jgi:tripartite-type tricarboxylate transporter receptor subunit TctC
MLMLGNDVKMTHVPYTGAGPAIVGLLGGQVDALATGPATIVQHVQSGRIRALAHWGEGRLSTLPDVPSLTELGMPITFAQWAGLFAPADTPEPVVARLREAAKAAGADPKVREVLLKAGSPVLYQDAVEFKAYVDADAAKMADVVKRIGKIE